MGFGGAQSGTRLSAAIAGSLFSAIVRMSLSHVHLCRISLEPSRRIDASGDVTLTARFSLTISYFFPKSLPEVDERQNQWLLNVPPYPFGHRYPLEGRDCV